MTQKIAVLGGGIGSLSTVYALTSIPGWQERYEITVYQQGWRLGGKGASGRNQQLAQRIEEHGFHIWMGFYHNAFRVMRECYAERATCVPDPGLFRTWLDAFQPHEFDVLVEHIDGQYRLWPITHPARAGLPGEEVPARAPWEHVREVLGWLREKAAAIPAREHHLLASLAHPIDLIERTVRRLGREAEAAGELGALATLDLARDLAEHLDPDVSSHHPQDHDLLIDLLDHTRARIRQALGDAGQTDTLRRLIISLDLGTTLLRGVVSDRVWSVGFDALDGEEFRAWLRRHGAAEFVVQSAILDSLYTAGFCFVDGRPDRADMAAGVAVQSLLRIFLRQRGPFSWKMRSGMGDVVFAPLYQVLAARGVRFQFFHKVTRVAYDAAAKTIPAIEIEQQVRLTTDYAPLMRVNGVDAWPSSPLVGSIENGAQLAAAIEAGTINLESYWSAPWRDAAPLTLVKGIDYDIVVLGISLGALGHLCADLIAALPPWRSMVDRVNTVATQSQQLWLTPTLPALGWPLASPVTQGYPPALGQWLDASHVIPRETWAAGSGPGTILYFCYVLEDVEPTPPATDRDYPRRTVARVEATSREWLAQHTGLAWPAAVRAGTMALDESLLCDASQQAGNDRLSAQYWRANVEPSERFVLSPTAATEFRLAVDGSGVDGLYLTGDWVRNGFNVGCVESTVISGLQCARAISGAPLEIIDEHFFMRRVELQEPG